MKRAGKALLFSEVSKVFEMIDSTLWRKRFVRRDGKVGKPRIVNNTANTTEGYCHVKMYHTMELYHRIVWVLFNKKDIPEGAVIDHIDGNTINNNPNNLRLVNDRINSQNKKRHRQGRLVGTYYHRSAKKWVAQITVTGKAYHLGLFPTEQEAHQAYLKALEGLANERVCN